MKRQGLTFSTLTLAGMFAAGSFASTSFAGDGGPCEGIAFQAYLGSLSSLQGDFYINYGNCLNQPDLAAQNKCLALALAELQEGLELADSQFDARVQLCGLLGGGTFAPDIDPDNFSSTIGHPYYPLVPGMVKTFEVDTDEGLETIVVSVTNETREIMGVVCLAVRDLVTLTDPVTLED